MFLEIKNAAEEIDERQMYVQAEPYLLIFHGNHNPEWMCNLFRLRGMCCCLMRKCVNVTKMFVLLSQIYSSFCVFIYLSCNLHKTGTKVQGPRFV